jgi:hypothetical protein
MAGSMPPAPGCNFMPPPAAPCPHSKPSDAQAESGVGAARASGRVLVPCLLAAPYQDGSTLDWASLHRSDTMLVWL